VRSCDDESSGSVRLVTARIVAMVCLARSRRVRSIRSDKSRPSRAKYVAVRRVEWQRRLRPEAIRPDV